MDKLLTQEDLAKRWQVSKRTIENWRKDGIIQPVKGVPAIRFNPQYIAELEGTKLEKFSPIERRRMERKIEELENENKRLKSIVSNILSITSEAINY
ncbi:helix-turn-helix domain-containing protein [Caloranaerobacter sp. DY30410]|uniref:helix-turn-helix domain-containing protein n=1 Tax=Caloranaerobacter sp. DY30410 TaxID=3238305 RepID=UPI003D063CD1